MDEIKKIREAIEMPEKSDIYRLLSCIASISAALISLWAMGWPAYSFIHLILIPAGCLFSRNFASRKLVIVKLFISLFMLVSLWDFFQHFMSSHLGPAGPLSMLLIRLQIFHSFDLPASKDLKYSIAVAGILVITSGFFSSEALYIALAALFAFIFFVSMSFSERSFLINSVQKSACVIAGTSGALKRFSAVAGIFVGCSSVLGLLFFAFLPRVNLSSIRIVSLEKYNLAACFSSSANSEASSDSRYSGTLKKISKAADGYFGFGESMDLNYRGKLSDDLVMKVKTSFPAYYRGAVFSVYDGASWKIDDQFEPNELHAMDGIIFLMAHVHKGTEAVHVFNIEKDMSNIVYTANFADRLYFPGNEAYIGGNREIFSSYPLEKGMSYAAISLRGSTYNAFSVRRPKKHEKVGNIREYFRNCNNRLIESCLELPNLSGRIKEFAEQFDIIENDSERAKAICDKIRSSCEYDINVGRFPEGAETADYFLFESKKGYCEHFATAMAVVCRLNGLPCRVVTGFPPGKMNPFTGLYEIRESDAHAWVEVFTGDAGVIELDPTPGYSAVMAVEKPEPAFKSVFSSIASAFSDGVFLLLLGIIIVLSSVFFIMLSSMKKKASMALKASFTGDERRAVSEAPVLRASFYALFDALRKKGRPRKDSETVSEYSSSFDLKIPIASRLVAFLGFYESLRYSENPSEEDIKKAASESASISCEIRRSKGL